MSSVGTRRVASNLEHLLKQGTSLAAARGVSWQLPLHSACSKSANIDAYFQVGMLRTIGNR